MATPYSLVKLYAEGSAVTQIAAAEILGVADSTVSRWSDERLDPDTRKLTALGRLPASLGGAKVFSRADVEALAAELAEMRPA